SSAHAAIERCRLEHGASGLSVAGPSFVTLVESAASGHTSNAIACSAGELTVDDCLITGNDTGVSASGGGTIRISDSCVTDNAVGLAQSGGANLLSRLDNTVEGNGTDTSGVIGAYSPK